MLNQKSHKLKMTTESVSQKLVHQSKEAAFFRYLEFVIFDVHNLLLICDEILSASSQMCPVGLGREREAGLMGWKCTNKSALFRLITVIFPPPVRLLTLDI